MGCPVCAEGKLTRTAFRRKLSKKGKPLKPLNLIHMDLMGPMDVRSQHGGHYLLVLTDDATNYVWVYILKTKDQAEAKVTEWIVEQERQYPRYNIKALRSDRGGEFLGDLFRAWLTSKGILQDLACSYSPEMNGKAERMNRTLSEMARCMLIGSGLPKKYWEFAYHYAAWVQNRCIVPQNKVKTAFELLNRTQPSVAEAKVFGCMAQVFIPEKQRKRKAKNKLDPRARWAICRS